MADLEWYVDEYGRDSELCAAVKLKIDDEHSCFEYEDCLHCPYANFEERQIK